MGGRCSAGACRGISGEQEKKLINDIRRAISLADDPEARRWRERCPRAHGLSPDQCGHRQAGPDPCAGCSALKALNYQPDFPVTNYAIFLGGLNETLRLSLDDLTWREYELLQAFLTARAEHERERLEKDGH